jgi:hypothetical protein
MEMEIRIISKKEKEKYPNLLTNIYILLSKGPRKNKE